MGGISLKFATLETRGEMEPRCAPQLFLGSLLATRRSAIGQFLLFPLAIVPEAFAKADSSQFPSLPTLEMRREMEPRCVPQLFVGSLLSMRRSAIGQFLLCPW